MVVAMVTKLLSEILQQIFKNSLMTSHKMYMIYVCAYVLNCVLRWY